MENGCGAPSSRAATSAGSTPTSRASWAGVEHLRARARRYAIAGTLATGALTGGARSTAPAPTVSGAAGRGNGACTGGVAPGGGRPGAQRAGAERPGIVARRARFRRSTSSTNSRNAWAMPNLVRRRLVDRRSTLRTLPSDDRITMPWSSFDHSHRFSTVMSLRSSATSTRGGRRRRRVVNTSRR
ncbi:MAG: hypothetical protein EHM57_05385 [Actinobacteria bacterium]|nr:MAG: hypothetical protein EHM57_05385 [Actinomycetota bacterium]